ncbi:geranylgeranyl diphosphate synthase, type II [Desulfurobacterium pacificum]|uniref:Geranylgeranyl diphosphate synthase, type II n=1 Tax=Desulfurobacterium pacificum TaxID=240166 RepID=A0ABY1NKJ8_9BACT|nr:farnesyl diphosphate synthase [Desulfurobacterium pacificum]SMP12172.1 geranylgeranyl diphosphate synthase, type II [Desulfurobacterium pacificum]
MDLKSYLVERKKLIDKEIVKYLPPFPEFGFRLYEAVKYSLIVGGKRLRPILCLAGCEAVGGNYRNAVTPACAIEMIHTYSLIHDDLPAMDNDTLRRGHPTVWYKFDEVTAILAGDALLNRAFEVLSEWDFDCKVKIEVMKEISKASGMLGMVLGQQCDMDAEGRSDVSLEELLFIHRHKTGRLITASVVAGGITGLGNGEEIEALRKYGDGIGLAFQIIDDVLDVVGDQEKLGKNVGSDAEKGKVTFVTFYGVDGAKKKAREEVEKAVEALSVFPADKVEPLVEIAKFIVEREY